MKTSLYFSSCHFPGTCSRCTAHLRFSCCSRWRRGRVECAAVLIRVKEKKQKQKHGTPPEDTPDSVSSQHHYQQTVFAFQPQQSRSWSNLHYLWFGAICFFVANFQNELMLSTEWAETVVWKMYGVTEISAEVCAMRPHPSCYIILFRTFRVNSPLIFIVPAVLYSRILDIWWPKNHHLHICSFKDGICCHIIQMFWSLTFTEGLLSSPAIQFHASFLIICNFFLSSSLVLCWGAFCLYRQMKLLWTITNKKKIKHKIKPPNLNFHIFCFAVKCPWHVLQSK